MRQFFQILVESRPRGYLCGEVLGVQGWFSLPLSLSPGTGERGMAQPVVTQHRSCRLLQSYCSSLFIKGGCPWMLRANFLFSGCLAGLCSCLEVEWGAGREAVWGVGQRELWPEGDCLCLDAPWSSHLLFHWLEPVAPLCPGLRPCGSCSQGLPAKGYSMHSWALALSPSSDL